MSFLRSSDEQTFGLLPPHPEGSNTQICQRNIPDIFWCASTNQNDKSQGSSSGVEAAAQPLQESEPGAGLQQNPGL